MSFDFPDRQTQALCAGVLLLLLSGSFFARRSARRARTEAARAAADDLRKKVRAWWMLAALLGLSLMGGKAGAGLLFGFVAFLALREFLTLAPTRPGDHMALFLGFVGVLPLQFLSVGLEWRVLATVLIPVWAFLLLPIAAALAGDTRRFLARTSNVQWGLMVCVYCVSHAPLLLTLHIPGYERQNGKLLFFAIAATQLPDIFRYAGDRCFGRRPLAPGVLPGKTVEGSRFGIVMGTLLATLMWPVTPFAWWQAALFALLLALLGAGGALVMGAIKRDRGVEEYGHTITGHGGVLDRIDSLCFAVPVFYHLVRIFYST